MSKSTRGLRRLPRFASSEPACHIVWVERGRSPLNLQTVRVGYFARAGSEIALAGGTASNTTVSSGGL
jgi:hypothetical protein